MVFREFSSRVGKCCTSIMVVRVSVKCVHCATWNPYELWVVTDYLQALECVCVCRGGRGEGGKLRREQPVN